METMLTFAAILVGLFSTLVMVVLLLAGSPNASRQVIQRTKWLIAWIVIVQMFSMVISIALLFLERGGLGMGTALFPILFAVICLIVLFRVS